MEVEDGRLGRILEEYLREIGLDELNGLRRIKKCWGEIVGPTMKRKALPLMLNRGELTIITSSHVWTNEVGLRVIEIRENIKKSTGITVDRIFVKTEKNFVGEKKVAGKTKDGTN